MASPTLTLAGITVNQGDTYTFVANDFTGADTDSDFDHYLVDTLPTHGTLSYNGSPAVAGTTTFTEADLAAGKLKYANDGQSGSDDTAKYKAVDAASNMSSAGTQTITVTDGSWLVTYVESGFPSIATRFSLKATAQAQEAKLEAALGGTATTVFLPAAVVTGLPVDYFHGLDLFLASSPKVDTAKLNEIHDQARKLVTVLNRSENSDLAALVQTWGAALVLEPDGRAQLTADLAAQLRNIRNENEQIPATFAREFPYQYWWAVLDAAKALL